MRSASLNHVYRLVWDKIRQLWIPVAETSTSHGKSGRSGKVGGVTLLGGVLSAGLFLSSAWALPTGGQVSAGSGQIAQSGNTLSINQNSQNLAINWQDFSVGSNESVRFNQPNSSAIALNRILGQNPSQILGQLTSNGQVFLLNPNGVLFGQGAQVSVGGLVASTLNLSDQNFLAGHYQFTGSSAAGVSNSGTINTSNGGYIALLGANVSNSGSMTAPQGNVSLAAGQQVTLQLANGSLLGLTVDQGAVDALAQNHGLIQANGGQVLLTAQAADVLTKAVVNNDGIIEAQTINNHSGKILLMGDMTNGTTHVGGTLDASATTGGHGGQIETSAATVHVADNAIITTNARSGNSGTWLIDPTDFTISSGSAAQTTSGMGATTLSNALNSGNVTIMTDSAGAQNGDINVNAAVSSGSNNQLTLTALGGINVNANISLAGSLALNSARAITQTGSLSIGGTTAINAGTASVTLNNAANLFGGLVSLSGNGAISLNTGSVLQLNSANLGGSLNLTANNGILLNGSITTAGSQTYNSAVSLANDVTLTSSGTGANGAINLGSTVDGAHNLSIGTAGQATFGGAVGSSLALNSLTLTSNNALLSGNVTTTGSQTYTGAVALGNAVTMNSAGGNVTFVGSVDNASSATPESLTVTAQQGAVTFVSPVGSQNGALAGLTTSSQTFSAGGASNATFLNIGSQGLNISTTNGNINQGGKFIVAGSSNFSAANGNAVNLTNLNNIFTGAVSVSGTEIYLYAASNLNIASLSDGANGEVRLIAGGALNLAPTSINTGSADLTLTANGGQLTTAANLTGSIITLTGATGLAINNAVNATYGLSLLSSLGSISEGVSGSINTPTLIANALGDITLNNPANNIGTLSGVIANNFSLIDNANLSVTNTINAQTVKIQTTLGHSLTLNGQISASGTGNALVLASGNNFINNVGSNVLNVGAGNWLIWSQNPSQNQYGGLTPNFIQYNATYGQTGLLGTGNGFLYTLAPIINVTLQGVMQKIYDGTTTAMLGSSNYDVKGQVNGDTVNVSMPAGYYNTPNVADRLAVTATGLTIQSASNGNATVYGYQLRSSTATAAIGAITQAPLTVSGLTGTDRAYNGSLVDALTGTAVLNGLVYGENLTINSTNFGLLSSPNVGSQSLTANVIIGDGVGPNAGFASNYSLITQPILPNVNITPVALTVTGINGTDRTYNGSNIDLLTGTGSLSGLVNGETLILNNTTTGTLAGVNVGSQGLTTNFTLSDATGLAGNYYVIQPNLPNVNITPAQLIVTGLSGVSRAYNGSTSINLAGTASLFGMVNGETLTMNNTATGTLANPDAGQQGVTSAVTLGNGTGLASNYVLTQASLPNVLITPAILTLSGLNGTDRDYNGSTDDALTGTAVLNGLVNGETLTLGNIATGTLSSANAGSRSVTTSATLSDGLGKASNYTLVQSILPNVNISPVTLTVSGLSGTDRTYNGSNINLLTGTGALNGLVNGETLILNNTTTGVLASANAGSQAITTNFNLSNGTGLASNYTVIQPTLSNVNIIPAQLVVTGISGTNRTYNGTTLDLLTGTPTLFGMVNGETLTMSNTGVGILSSPNAGTQHVSTAIVLGNGTGLASNYVLNQNTLADVIISPAALSVVGSTAQDKSYDGTTAATLAGGTLSGTIFGNDNITLLQTGVFASPNAGKDIAVTATNSLMGNAAGNYVLIQPTTGLKANIIPAVLTISGLSGTDRTYNGTTIDTLTGSATLHGLVNGENLTLNDTSTGVLSSANAGSQSVTTAATLADGSGNGAGLASNYSLTQATLPNVTISPAALTITANDAQRNYGSANPVFTANALGLVGGDTLGSLGSLQLTTTATTSSPIGKYTITPSGLSNGNYTIQYVNGQLSIVLGSNGIGTGNDMGTGGNAGGPNDNGFGINDRNVLAALFDDKVQPEAMPSLSVLHVEGSGISLPHGAEESGL